MNKINSNNNDDTILSDSNNTTTTPNQPVLDFIFNSKYGLMING